MSPSDAAFLLGPVGACVVLPAAAIAIALGRQRWAVWVGGGLSALAVVGWMAYWRLWGQAFDLADALQEVPESLERRMRTIAAVTALATAALAVTAGVSLAGKRRSS